MTSTSPHELKDKTIVVTGASRGIGFEVAKEFAATGATVFILAEDNGIHQAAERIQRHAAGKVIAVECDIAVPAAVDLAFESIPHIDILINNAGYQPRTPIGSTLALVEQAFRRVIEINVLGTYYVTNRALALMGQGGRIIITSSIWGKTGAAEYSGYCASKHANLGFMRALALELGPRGITVNAVCPGWVDTEGAMWTVREIAAEVGKPVPEVVTSLLAHQPLPGMMMPGDISGIYLFLASAAAKDVTAQAISVDRGHFVG